ncbi:MAG: DUF4230 domain-containing protein [Candidatus Amulumruptor caecigallinarius]|nr:DUF4230 domain-containing protein [Candidatus Amulumruptor caecigallinarius]
MRKFIIYLVLILAAAVAAAALWMKCSNDNDPEVVVEPAKIEDIKNMVQLCSMEIYCEVPVKDTVNNKMLFAIQKQEGKISFDIEKLQISDTGDSLFVVLPPEIVDVRESTQMNSWRVIDSKGLDFFTSDKLTLEEENSIKRELRKKSVDRLYKNGTVARARKEATAQLKLLLENVYRKPTVVSDPSNP